ncbi:MAG: PQQ-dependent sugar dehydrogenase [Anaerolineales bacterium]|nr:PQQ-dependent sugar dehydrogenase [Anaerolineales bacterium]
MRKPKPSVWVWLGLALLLGLAGAFGLLRAAEAGGNSLGADWVEYATGLDQPVDIAFTGIATDTRLFVVERAGVIRIVLTNGTVLPTAFLDISTIVNSEAYTEMGLLGLAFDPDYATNGRFYLQYSDFANDGGPSNNGNIVLARYQVSADPNVALTTGVKLLTISHPSNENHNGGDLSFGPDGFLYMAPGDGAVSANAQSLTNLLGKVLRLNVSDVATYTVPVGNPFTQTVGAQPEIWAYGLRNPWRFSFDQATGDLYVADVGQQDWEEVNRVSSASDGGENYGWRCYEGTHTYNTTGCPPANTLTMPIFEYPHDPHVSVTGGFVYRGAAHPSLVGYYFLADFGSSYFWAINTGSNAAVPLGPMLAENANPSTFGQDPAGEIYVGDFNFGVIYKLTGPPPLPPVAYLPLALR